jgi:hypothetical protein
MIKLVKIIKIGPHELNSIGWDIAPDVQEPGFEPQTLHLSTFKMEFQATRLPTKKKSARLHRSRENVVEKMI